MSTLARVVLILSLLTIAPVEARPDVPNVMSGNVTLLGNIPDLGAIGGHVRTVDTLLGPKRYLLTTGAGGVSAYDVTVPEVPVLMNHLPLPHFSNEDVDFGGDLLIVSVDPRWMDIANVTGPTALGGLYLIDISKLPALTFAYVNPATGNRWTAPVVERNGHTTSCVRTDCSYAIVAGGSGFKIVDLRTPTAPKVIGGVCCASTHDAHLDAAGIVWVSGGGHVSAYDFTVPSAPRLLSSSSGGLDYQHNAQRPGAASWVPGAAKTAAGSTLLVTEEDFYPVLDQIQCIGQGRFQTRWVQNLTDTYGGVTTLDTWETELQVAGIVSPAAVCSAHYFDERDEIVAIAWYQQGIRFLDVSDPSDIKQVGYYINPTTAVYSIEWAGVGTLGGEIAYTFDPSRGIDILRFDRSPIVVEAPILPQWLDAEAPSGVPHPTFGYACRLPAVA